MGTRHLASSMACPRNEAGSLVPMVAALAIAAFVGASAKAVDWRRWYGGNWSEASNWENQTMPKDGEYVKLMNTTEGAVFNIDVDSVSVKSMHWGDETETSGNKPFTLKGGAINNAGWITAYCAVTCENDITFTSDSPTMVFNAACILNGDVTAQKSQLKIAGKQNSSAGRSTFNGAVSVANGTLDFSYAAGEYGSHVFNGPVTAKKVQWANLTSTSGKPFVYFNSDKNQWTTLQTGYAKLWPGCEGALPAGSTVNFPETGSSSGWVFNLRNYNQSIDRITSKATSAKNPCLRSHSGEDNVGTTEATRLTLKATASDENSVRVYDKITLVYAPTGDYSQTFATNFAHTTSGDIIVSNGTFRVAGTSSFANVKRIVVADGATFALLTEASDALAGVTNITLGANAHFAITNAATPFTASAVSLDMAETSTFDLPDGANWLFSSVTVGGVPLDGGTYSDGGRFSGNGKITIPDTAAQTVEATWTGGGGADDGIATAANWEGGETPKLAAKSLTPLFASGGEKATVDRALDFKGLRFGGDSASFTVVSNTPAASLTLREDGVEVAASHTAAVDVPVALASDQSWTVASGAVLEFDAPVGMASPYVVAASGAGTLRLNAPEGNGFLGGFAVSGGLSVGVYSPVNAFGPASDEAVTINESKLYLHGGVIERPIEIVGQGSGSQYYWFTVEEGTTTLTKPFTQKDGNFWRPRIVTDAKLITEGGVTVWTQVFAGGGGEWIVRGKPWKHTNGSSGACGLVADGATVRFETDGNVIRRLWLHSGSVVCGVDNAFGGNREAELLFDGSGAGGTLDLGGHSATFKNVSSLSTGVVASETLGMLKFTGQNAAITNRAVRFTGAAGLEMCGTGAIVITNAMESAGALSVTKGTLEFTETGSWANAAGVSVSGTGRLVVAAAKTFPRTAEVAISDSGVIEIPEGVTLRVGRLTVDGVEVHGIFGSAESAADKTYASRFAGKGKLAAGRLGFAVYLR